MPAPRPIQFRADIGPIAELAIAATQAQTRRRDFERQQGFDQRIIAGNQALSQRQNKVEAQFRLDQSRQATVRRAPATPFALQRAAQRLQGQQAPTEAPPRGGRNLAEARPAQGFSTFQTPQGTGRIDAATGQVTRLSPGIGEELIDPITGELNLSRLPDRFRDPTAVAQDQEFVSGLRPSGFVVPGREAPQLLPGVQEQLDLIGSAPNLPQEQRDFLQRAALSGEFSTPQILNEIQQSIPKPSDPRKIDGLSIRDRQLEILRLRRILLGIPADEFNAGSRVLVAQAITAQQEIIKRQQVIPDAPQLSGKSLSNPAPTPSGEGQVLSRDMAIAFMREAGGDPIRAEQLARDAGFNVIQR